MLNTQSSRYHFYFQSNAMLPLPFILTDILSTSKCSNQLFDWSVLVTPINGNATAFYKKTSPLLFLTHYSTEVLFHIHLDLKSNLLQKHPAAWDYVLLTRYLFCPLSVLPLDQVAQDAEVCQPEPPPGAPVCLLPDLVHLCPVRRSQNERCPSQFSVQPTVLPRGRHRLGGPRG